MKRQKYKSGGKFYVRLLCLLCLSVGLLPANLYAENTTGYYLSADVALRRLELSTAVKFYDKLIRTQLRETTKINPDTRRLMISKAAQAYVLAGQFEKAAKLTEHNDSYAIPHLLHVLQAMRRQEWQTAMRQLDNISETQENRVWHYWVVPLLRVWILAGDGQSQKALAALEDLRSIEALADIMPLQETRLYLQLQQPHKVLEILTDTGADVGDLPPLFLAHYLQAVALTEGREAALAILRRKSPSVGAAGAAGEAGHYHTHILREVRQALESDIPIEATLVPPARAVGDLFLYIAELLSRELPQEALIYARLADYAVAENHAAIYLIADILADRAQYDEAINILQSFVKRQGHGGAEEEGGEEGGFAVDLRIGDYLLKAGKRAEAERRLLDLRRRHPEDGQVREALGALYRHTESYRQAIDLYDEEIALSDSPQARHWRIFYLRGIAYERLKEWRRAERDLLQAYELAPDNPYVMNYLGYSWVDRGENLQKAFHLLQKAESLRGNDGAIADSLGWAYYRLGDYSSAVKYLEKAVSLSPESSVIVDHLGDAYWRIGRRHEARFQWRRALRMQDMTDELRKIIRRKLQQAEQGDVILSSLILFGLDIFR